MKYLPILPIYIDINEIKIIILLENKNICTIIIIIVYSIKKYYFIVFKDKFSTN